MIFKPFLFTVMVSLFLFLANASWAKCFSGRIKHINNGELLEYEKRYCLIRPAQSKYPFMVSTGCFSTDCLKKYRPEKAIELKSLLSPTGSPGHKLCKRLGGFPQLIEFLTDLGQWKHSSRCLFDDHNYVEIDYLFFKLKQQKVLI